MGETTPSGRSGRRELRWLVALVVALLVVVAALLVPRWLGSPDAGGTPSPTVAEPAPPDAPPSGWRIEQYRGVTFHVPDAWGYAFEPSGSWCAADGNRWEDPYVALGRADVELAIACPDIPAELVTQHVAVAETGREVPDLPEVAGLHVVTRELGGVRLRAYSPDRATAERIAASMSTDGLRCAPELPTDTDRRPDPVGAVGDLTPTGDATVCQYEIPQVEAGPRTDPRRTAAPARLRAVATLPRADADRFLTALAGSGPGSYDCADTVVGPSLELVLAVRIPTGDGTKEFWFRAGSCGDRDGTSFGGFDDGTRVYAPTRDTCRTLMREPVIFQVGSGQVAEACAP